MPNWRGEDSCVVLLFLYMSSCSWKPLNHFFMPNGTRVKNNKCEQVAVANSSTRSVFNARLVKIIVSLPYFVTVSRKSGDVLLARIKLTHP